MASSPHEDTHVSNFGDHLLLEEPQNAPSGFGKETQSMKESSNNEVKQFGEVKPPHDGVLEGGPRKEEQEAETIWSLKCGDNGDLMRDKVSIFDKTGAAGIKVADQTVSKSGGDENTEVDEFIEFKDCLGRRFRLPYKGVKKWKVISFSQKNLIHGLPSTCPSIAGPFHFTPDN
jgi:hypothetical protein